LRPGVAKQFAGLLVDQCAVKRVALVLVGQLLLEGKSQGSPYVGDRTEIDQLELDPETVTLAGEAIDE